MIHGHRRIGRDGGRHVAGDHPVARIIRGTERGQSSIGSAGIGSFAVPASLSLLGCGLTGEAV